jgi:predicted RNase H-like nuclease (RuvC/YqgF family)
MTQPEVQPTGQEPAATEPNTPAAPPAPAAPKAPKTEEWYEAEIRKLRDENASWRTKIRDAQPTMEELAKEIETLKSDRDKATREALVASIGRDLPEDLLNELRESSATTEEALTKKAAVLRKYAEIAKGKESNEAPPEKLGGGLGGGTGGDSFDAAEVVRGVRARRG